MRLRLRITPASGPGFDFVADKPVVRIGRDPASELCFAEAADNVSWEHATITVSDRAATLADQESTNGTFLNATPTRLKTAALKIGDEFRLGQTGPRLKVLDLELNSTPVPIPPRPKPTMTRPAPPPAPSEGVSVTRKLLLETQSRNRSLTAILVGVFLALLLLIAGAIWLIDTRGRSTDQAVTEVKKDVKQVDARLDETAKQLAGLSQDVKGLATSFDETNRRNDEIRKDDARKLDVVAAEARQANQDIMAELRKKPPAEQPVADVAALNKARGAAAAPDADDPPLELKPGLVLSVRRRGSANRRGVDYENAVLVAATPTTLHVASLDPAKPKTIAVDEIETVFVRNQMYTYNPSSNLFETGLSFFRLDKNNGSFVRIPRQEVDLSSCERGETEGEIVTQCFLNRSGGFVVVVPKNKFNSSQFEANVLLRIVTNFGVHTWYDPDRTYRFKTHQQIAKELNEEYERKKKESDAEEWKKKVEAYKLATDRIRALRPYWWRGW
jgi:pSer/pThr/pTyr-binding forkhead associated (FHA) protein/uncharacterized protein YoxC